MRYSSAFFLTSKYKIVGEAMPFKDLERRREYQREYMRRWYQENKARHIGYVRSREKRIKAWLREYKESLGCEMCGETHPACLEFHHTNSQEKRFNMGRLDAYLSLKLIRTEIAKCRLLCANCHRKEHWDERHAKSQAKPLSNDKRITVDEKSNRNPFFSD
jgi:hypothetical protein